MGIHLVTLRLWADGERNPVIWVGRERRFSTTGIGALKTGPGGRRPARERLEGLYLRVSGSTGQETLLAAQAAASKASHQ